MLRLEIHPDWIKLASEWHGGQWTALYSVSSTGFLYQNKVHLLVSELLDLLRGELRHQEGLIQEFYFWAKGVKEAFEVAGLLE